MTNATRILAAFQTVPDLAGEWIVEPQDEKIFRVRRNTRSFFVKCIAAGDPHGQNELKINQSVLAEAPIPVPILKHVLPSGGDSLAVWDWVEGEDMRLSHRELLPEAFRQLGAFHAAQRRNCPVSSPVSGETFDTIEELLDGDIHLLCANLPPAAREECNILLRQLSRGYPTLIHGDMHPGNLYATPSGSMFVDWGYSRWSINLLDLDYIRSIPIRPPESEWWIIQPEEADRILTAYFSTCGLPDVNAREIQHAVMVWAMLWSLYTIRNSDDTTMRAVCQQRLDFLLEGSPMNIVVFDVETQNLFEDVGGRRNIAALKISCAVSWSSARNDFSVYWEKDVPALIVELKSAGRVVGFNIKGFDYEVLRPYAPEERLQFLPTLDIMDDLFRTLSFRVSLDSVARATLGESKSADGIQAVTWWREGKLDLLAEYCKVDVDVTRRIYEFGCSNGFVHYFTRLGSKQKVSVNWKC